MAQVSDKTLSGDQSGSAYASELQGIIDAVVSTFSGGVAPTSEALVEGLLWHDTANDRLKIFTNGNFQTLPINTSTGGIVASAGQGVTGLTLANFSSGIIDTSVSSGDDDTTVPTSKAVFDHVVSAIAGEASARDGAITVHDGLTVAHGVAGDLVGTTDTQTLTNKTISGATIDGATAISGTPTIAGATINSSTVGATTPATGKFTTLTSTTGATVDSGGVTVTAGGLTVSADGATVTGDSSITGALDVTGNLIVGAEISGGASGTLTIDPDPAGTSGTLVVDGNLTVNGTTTTINSTEKSLADKDLVLANGATDLAGVDGAGLHLGTSIEESWTYDNANTQWETKSAAISSANGFKVGDSSVIDSSGNWDGGNLPTSSLDGTIANTNLSNATVTNKGVASFATADFSVTAGAVTVKADGIDPATQVGAGALPTDVTISQDSISDTVSVAKGGTGTTSITSGSLIVGNGTGAVSEATVGSGLSVNASDELVVDLTTSKLETIGDVVAPAAGTADDGKFLKFNASLNSGDGGWDFSSTTADVSAVGDWGLKTNVVTPTSDKRILQYDADATPNFAWNDSISVGSASITNALGVTDVNATGTVTGATVAAGTITASGDATITGSTTLNGDVTIGDNAGDDITITGSITNNLIPKGDRSRNLGSADAEWKNIFVEKIQLKGTQEISDIDTDISTVPLVSAVDHNKTIPTANAVRTYVDNLDAGGSIVIEAVGGSSKDVTSGFITIVTVSGETKLFRAKSNQPSVLKGTGFDGTGGGTNFETGANWEELQLGGGSGSSAIDNFIGDGATTAFDLSVTPVSISNVTIFVDGVYQNRNLPVAFRTFTLSSNTVTLSEAPSTGARIQVLTGEQSNVGTGTIGNLTSTGVISAVTVTATSEMNTGSLTATGTVEANAYTGDGSGLDDATPVLSVTEGFCTFTDGSDATSFTTKVTCEAAVDGSSVAGTWTNKKLNIAILGNTGSIDVVDLIDNIDELGE